MNSQVDFVERRAHPRVGVMAQLEDITYSILRKQGIVGGPRNEEPAFRPIKQRVDQQGVPQWQA